MPFTSLGLLDTFCGFRRGVSQVQAALIEQRMRADTAELDYREAATKSKSRSKKPAMSSRHQNLQPRVAFSDVILSVIRLR